MAQILMRLIIILKQLFTFVLIFILTLFQLKSQDLVYKGKNLRYSHAPRDFIIQLSPNYIYREDAFPRIAGSFNMQYFIGKSVSINGNLALGQDYAHFGLGLLGIPLLSFGGFYSWLGSDEFVPLLIVLAGSFENISFHFPVGQNLDISPHFSLLRFQYLYKQPKSQHEDFELCLALGSRLNYYLTDHWMVAPSLEYTRTYSSGLDGLQFGLYLGYYFKSRISEEIF